MDAKVKVGSDPTGNVVVKSKNNPEYGYIRVEQNRMVVDGKGFARMLPLSALIPGKVKDLAAFGWEAGQEVEGRVVVKESLQPFNRKSPERDYKVAGRSGIVCTVDGAPIYRKHIYVLAGNADDTSVEHTNGDDITAAYALAKVGGSDASDTDFTL